MKGKPSARHLHDGLSDTTDVVAGFEVGGVDYVIQAHPHRRGAGGANPSSQRPCRPATARESPRDNLRQPDCSGRIADGRADPRETEVLSWLAKAKPIETLRDILGMSHRTVNKHLEHI